jgi:BCD family chlorophyll transporter-like MFS transporter
MRKLRLPVPSWVRAYGIKVMPFADAASPDLPLSRLLRLSLFQAVIGMCTALLVGTLNRIMIVELGVPAWWVALAVALPMVFAPLRALIGYRSDTHPSALGLRRIPYLWLGSLLLFGGLATLPFALLLLSEAQDANLWVGRVGACLAFLLLGAGMQVTQTAGMALANDLAEEDKRPRVVALLYTMLLLGMIVSSACYAWLLHDFSPLRLIQVIQGSAVCVLVLNLLALWKQEARQAKRGERESGGFSRHWHALMAQPQMRRFLWTVGLGSCAFSMQDIVLEPYGAQVLGMNVGMTSELTALSAGGALLAFALSSHWLSRGLHACRLASMGALVGVVAFAAVIFSGPLLAPTMFKTGAALVGFGGGLFSVGMLVTAMSFGDSHLSGLVLGAWGAVQATTSGAAMALGGALRDGVDALAQAGLLGEVLQSPLTGYSFVYHLEMYLLFVVLVALGPMVRRQHSSTSAVSSRPFGLAEFPS